MIKIEKIENLPIIKIEIKDAAILKTGLKDINGNELPNQGIVIKKVIHNSSNVKIQYIVPEENNFYSYLTAKLKTIDMSDFLSRCKK